LAKLLSDADEEKAFREHAIEIGHLARSWNRLHDNLGEIFSQIVSPQYPFVSLRIWHSIMSDRTQREMLKIAYQTKGALDTKRFPQAEDSLKWLIGEAQKLADRRNDAIHAPFRVGIQVFNDFKIIVEPDTGHENPRAKKLEGKDVLSELKFYRASSDTLLEYSTAISRSFFLDAPWPQKPTMPTLSPCRNHKATRRKNAPK
jgi:hypothetical protein